MKINNNFHFSLPTHRTLNNLNILPISPGCMDSGWYYLSTFRNLNDFMFYF